LDEYLEKWIQKPKNYEVVKYLKEGYRANKISEMVGVHVITITKINKYLPSLEQTNVEPPICKNKFLGKNGKYFTQLYSYVIFITKELYIMEKNRFKQLLESTIGNSKPLLTEQDMVECTLTISRVKKHRRIHIET
jgi:hypothetical protein